MEDSIYEKYGIDPNRVPTNAEVEMVAYCFDVTLKEADQILNARRFNNNGHGGNTSACHAPSRVGV